VSSTPTSWRVAPAVATAAAGVLTLASSLLPTVPWREQVLESIEPGSAQHLAHAVAILGGLVLLGLAVRILHGRRRPVHAAVVVLGVVAVVHLAKGLDYEEAGIALGIAAVLRLGVRAAGHDAEPPRAATAALLALLAFAGAYILAFTIELTSGRGALGAQLRDAAGMLSGASAAALGDEGAAILHVLAALALVGTVAFVRSVLAPGRARDGHDPREHERAAAIVAAHAGDSIAPFTLRADKAFFFAHGGVLAYRTLRETAVVSGDPVGPAGNAPAILDAFLAFARHRGWDVVVLAARDEHLDAYRALGLRTLRIGSEAVVDPRGFDLQGRERKTVRKAVHRVERRGWSIELVNGGELTRRHVAEIGAVERAWRARHTRLYGYAMAMDRLWGAQEDEGDLYVLARAPWGEVRAFQRYVPYRGGLSLDAMRRLDDEPNGISDALVAAALAHARDGGCREVSLNFSSFAHVMAAETLERRIHRLARWALRRMRHRFQLERLARFASKFGPEWRPRHLVYTSQVRLPLAALRVMQAEAYVRPLRVRVDPSGWHPAPRPARLATASNGRA
jgi:lysyl-tRNA synthetase class 2